MPFKKEQEFGKKVSSLHTARLALLFQLSMCSFQLGTILGTSPTKDAFEENVKKAKFLRSLHGWIEGVESFYQKAIFTLFYQLLSFCSNDYKRIIQILTPLHPTVYLEDIDLIYPNTYYRGKKKWEVVLLLDKKTKLYIGHVRLSDPVFDRCEMISIRQSLANAVLRDSPCGRSAQSAQSAQRGVDRVAHRLLTQVIHQCLSKDGDTVEVTEPFGRMREILSHCNFKKRNLDYVGKIEDILLKCIYSD